MLIRGSVARGEAGVNNEGIRHEKERWAREKKVNEIPGAKGELGETEIVYTPADVPDFDYMTDLGLPGEYPFTRGVYPGMYRRGPWQMRLYAGFGTAEDTNKRWKFLLDSGNSGVSCAFDLPTQIGLDSDDPMAQGEVGRVGVAIDTLRDMEIMYDGLPLDKIVSSFNTNAPCAIILAMYIALAEQQRIPAEKLMGTLANDLLTEFVARGTWVFPPKPSMRLTSDIVEYCVRNIPKFYPYNIRGILFREAGSTMAQEIGFSFANAIAYIEDVLKRGMDIDSFAPRISFFFASGTEIFEEAAKYRAARRLWARIMKEKFHAKNPSSMLLRFTGMIGGSYYRSREPLNNLVRGAYGALANVLGGVQGMIQPAWDEAFAIPTEESARLALRTQQICAYETGVMKTVDPLGGSYYIEALTNQVEKAIISKMEEVEAHGGAVPDVESGFMKQQIEQEAYKTALEEGSGERALVGVNKFLSEEKDHKPVLHRPDPNVQQKQLERLRQVKAERDNDAVRESLRKLTEAARSEANLMPCVLEAVKTYATLGEMMDAMKDAFGVFREQTTL